MRNASRLACSRRPTTGSISTISSGRRVRTEQRLERSHERVSRNPTRSLAVRRVAARGLQHDAPDDRDGWPSRVQPRLPLLPDLGAPRRLAAPRRGGGSARDRSGPERRRHRGGDRLLRRPALRGGWVPRATCSRRTSRSRCCATSRSVSRSTAWRTWRWFAARSIIPPSRPRAAISCCSPNVYKEIDDRVAYMERARSALRPDGRVAILGFRSRVRGPGPPARDRLPEERVIEELEAAGFVLGAQHDFLYRQYLLVFEQVAVESTAKVGAAELSGR